MRIRTLSLLLAILLCQPLSVLAQNTAPTARLGGNATAKPAIAPITPQSRSRYQSGRWSYRNPSALPSAGKGYEPSERESPALGQWSSNRLGTSSLSRYTSGYRSQWNPYSGYSYGYSNGFGRTLYGYGNGYQGLKNGYLGFGGNGHFSNGAFSTGH